MKPNRRISGSGSRSGSAVLIILVLLACMAALLAANSTTLHALKQELKQIDQRQQKKFAPRPGP
jgi:type II secretory pathway component PulK